MMRRWLLVLFFVLLLPVVPSVLGQGAYPPRSDMFVNDYAELLTEADASDVQQLLSDLQAAHGVEAVVVTINSIADYDTGDTTIEAFATGLFNTWGIGDATKNDGVLLLVAVKDRKVRVELGSGYGSGPSSEMQAVIDRYVLPKFRANAYSAGILIGTQAMIAKLTDQPLPETGDVPPTRVPFASTGSGTTSTRNTDSSLGGLLLVAVMAIGVFALIRLAVNGSDSEGWSSDQDNHDDDDHRWNRTDSNRRSSWTSSSHRSSSSGSSSNRSSSSSRKGGGRSSGGGASGSW
jgi:uncharacterized membrane protein YgcG